MAERRVQLLRMILAKLFSQLTRLKLQVLIILQFSFIYHPVRRFYGRLYAKYQSNPTDEFRQQQARKHSEDISDLLGLSDEHPFVRVYKKCSFAMLLYVITRALLPLEAVIGLFNPSLPPHCYLLGRLMLIGPMPKNFDLLICSYHVAWRIWRDYLNRYLKLDLAAFLVINNEAVERNFGRDGEGHDPEKLSTLDKYLSSMMYYVVEPGSKTLLRLRPNRSKESYHELRKATARVFIRVAILTVSFVVCFAPLIAYSYLLDHQYLKEFPMCYPTLDALYRNSQLSEASITLEEHKIFANTFDLLMNTFIWLDTWLSFALASSVTYLLNKDTQIYWRNLHKRICRSLNRTRAQHHLRALQYLSRARSSTSERTGGSADLFDDQWVASEYDSHEVQAMLRDYFRQFKSVNRFTSRFILTGTLIWLSYFSCSTYLRIMRADEERVLNSTRFVSAAILVFLSLVSLELFTLRRNVLKTYHNICSLMAYDSSSCKIKYIGELEYFTYKNRASYTIGNQPFTPVTLLTIAGWTYSCASIVENFFPVSQLTGGSSGSLIRQ